MVQLDAAVAQVLPDSEADVSTRGRQKRVFKFSSIRVPDLKGFEEREGSWRENRGTGFGFGGVIQMPQPHDADRPVRFFAILLVVPVRARERNLGSGSRFVWKGAAS